MKLAIYGAGAMGTSLGALFARANVACDLISRNEAHIRALNEHGAHVFGVEEFCVPVRAITPSEMGKYDVVFLCAKQRQNEEIARFLFEHLSNDGVVVSAQNGFPEIDLANVLGVERVYGCTLSWGAERTGAGQVTLTSSSGFHFALGALAQGNKLEEIASLLSKIGQVTLGNLREIRFAKLAINSSFSTLSAMSGLTFLEIAKKYNKVARKLLYESFAVAKAMGCKALPLNGHDLFRIFKGLKAGLCLKIAMRKYRDTRSGMCLDLENGKRCEIDFVSGTVVRLGEKYGVETPLQARAVALVHEIENGLAELSPESIALL